LGKESEEIVVVSEAPLPQRLTPGRKHIGAEALRQQQPILEAGACQLLPLANS
jgi:hypothetical protein